MANIIIKSEERIEREKQTLRDYGIHPERATSVQKELAAAVANGVNVAHNEMRRNER